MGKFKFVNGVMVDTSKAPPPPSQIPMAAIVSTPEELAEVSADYQVATGNPMIVPVATAVAIENYTDNAAFTDKFKNPRLNYEEMLDKLSFLFAKYEVPVGLLPKLCALSEYNINIIIDDSGSMGNDTDSTCAECMSDYLKAYFRGVSRNMTRFEEEEDRLHTMIDFLAYIPTGPITVMCMNRADSFTLSRENKTPEQFMAEGHSYTRKMFTSGPNGGTPTMAMMKRTFSTAVGKTMHYLFTDGVPSDCNVTDLAKFLKNRANPQFNPLTLVSCTNVDSEAEWMKEIEEIGPYMSEIDDYNDELKEVLHDQGPTFPYSRGFWIMCLLVSAINPFDLDAMDESRPFTKFTLDNILGRPVTQQEYAKYWSEHKRSREYQDMFARFCTEQKHAAEILGADKKVPVNKLTGMIRGMFS